MSRVRNIEKLAPNLCVFKTQRLKTKTLNKRKKM